MKTTAYYMRWMRAITNGRCGKEPAMYYNDIIDIIEKKKDWLEVELENELFARRCYEAERNVDILIFVRSNISELIHQIDECNKLVDMAKERFSQESENGNIW